MPTTTYTSELYITKNLQLSDPSVLALFGAEAPQEGQHYLFTTFTDGGGGVAKKHGNRNDRKSLPVRVSNGDLLWSEQADHLSLEICKEMGMEDAWNADCKSRDCALRDCALCAPSLESNLVGKFQEQGHWCDVQLRHPSQETFDSAIRFSVRSPLSTAQSRTDAEGLAGPQLPTVSETEAKASSRSPDAESSGRKSASEPYEFQEDGSQASPAQSADSIPTMATARSDTAKTAVLDGGIAPSTLDPSGDLLNDGVAGDGVNEPQLISGRSRSPELNFDC